MRSTKPRVQTVNSSFEDLRVLRDDIVRTGTVVHLVNTSFDDWFVMRKIMSTNLKNKLSEDVEDDDIVELKPLDYSDTMCSILHTLHTLPAKSKQEILTSTSNTLSTCEFSIIDSHEYSNRNKLLKDLVLEIYKETEYLQKNICPEIETRGISVYVEETDTPHVFNTVIQYVYILMGHIPPQEAVPVVVPEPPKPKRNRHKNRRRNQAAAAVAASLEVPGVPVASDLVEDLHEVDEDPC